MKKYWIHLVALIVALSVGGLSALRLGQDINYDLLNYHYYNPYALLTGAVEHNIAVGGVVSYENPVRDIPGYLLISSFSPKAAGVTLGALQGLNIFLLFEICLLLFARLRVKPLRRYGLALAIAVLSFFSACGISVIGSTMGDNISSIFILAGLWGLLYALGKPNPRFNPRLVRVAAFFTMGVGMGLKLTSVAYAVGLLAAGFLVVGSVRQKLKESLWHIVGLLGGILLSAGFWYAYMWVLFKNPIFPFYNGLFGSEYYPKENFIDERWVATSFWQGLTEPFQYFVTQALSVEIPFRDPRLALAVSAVVILLIYLAVRRWVLKRKGSGLANWSKQHTALVLFFAVSYVVWSVQFSYYRYALPLEFVSLVIIAVVLYGLLRWFWAATIVLAAAVTYIALATVPIDWGRVPWQANYFGVYKGDFAHLQDATVLMAGYNPQSFLIPYFPDSTQTIRVASDLSSPAMGTPAMQAKIREAVEKRKAAGSPFFAIRDDAEALVVDGTLINFGFRTGECKKIHTHVRAGLKPQYRLCELERID